MKGLGVIAASGLVIAAAAAPLAVAAAPTAGESRNDISVNVANGERQVYFGWYDVATNESLSATASASNLYQAADVPAAVHAASLNQTSLLEVRWTFFGAAPGLKPDYQANWDTLAAQVRLFQVSFARFLLSMCLRETAWLSYSVRVNVQ